LGLIGWGSRNCNVTSTTTLEDTSFIQDRTKESNTQRKERGQTRNREREKTVRKRGKEREREAERERERERETETERDKRKVGKTRCRKQEGENKMIFSKKHASLFK
jgi:hypothetical protein